MKLCCFGKELLFPIGIKFLLTQWWKSSSFLFFFLPCLTRPTKSFPTHVPFLYPNPPANFTHRLSPTITRPLIRTLPVLLPHTLFLHFLFLLHSTSYPLHSLYYLFLLFPFSSSPLPLCLSTHSCIPLRIYVGTHTHTHNGQAEEQLSPRKET